MNSRGNHGKVQKQQTLQQHRPLQASKQMAYDVFGNVIMALETFEAREATEKGYRVPVKSNISIVPQEFKTNEDVQACTEAQLQVFEAHMNFCPEDIAKEVRPEMKKMVVHWASARGLQDQIPVSKTDVYAAKLYEILDTGTTKHDYTALLGESELTKEQLMRNINLLGQGQAKAEKLDQSFQSDPRKTAEIPGVRRGRNPKDGLERLALTGHNLKQSLKKLRDEMGIPRDAR